MMLTSTYHTVWSKLFFPVLYKSRERIKRLRIVNHILFTYFWVGGGCFEVRFLFLSLAVLELSLSSQLASDSQRLLRPKACTTITWLSSQSITSLKVLFSLCFLILESQHFAQNSFMYCDLNFCFFGARNYGYLGVQAVFSFEFFYETVV